VSTGFPVQRTRMGEDTPCFTAEKPRNVPATMIPRFELRRLFGSPSCRRGRAPMRPPAGERAPLRPDRGEPREPALRPVRSRGAPGASRRIGTADRPLGAWVPGPDPSPLVRRPRRPADLPVRREETRDRLLLEARCSWLPSIRAVHRPVHGSVFLPDARDPLARPLFPDGTFTVDRPRLPGRRNPGWAC